MKPQRILVTGATGYIGSAVAERLVRRGHQVFGLTREPDNTRTLADMGVTPVVGDLGVPGGTWRGILQNCDAAVHTAFDAQNGAADVDLCALDALRTAALDGRMRKVLYTSGIWVHGRGQHGRADENTPIAPLPVVQWRAVHEEIVLDLTDHEVGVVILRPGMVYGEQRGILGGWFAEAHEHHTVTYPGDGTQHWNLVHRDDLADAYVLALENGASGTRYLIADEAPHTVRQMAEAVATTTGSRAVSWPAEELIRSHGGYGEALLNDLTVSTAKARRELGWSPKHPSFVAEVETLWRDWQGARVATVR